MMTQTNNPFITPVLNLLPKYMQQEMTLLAPFLTSEEREMAYKQLQSINNGLRENASRRVTLLRSANQICSTAKREYGPSLHRIAEKRDRAAEGMLLQDLLTQL